MTHEWDGWLHSPEPGWEEADLQHFAAIVRGSFVSGEGSALSVRYFRRSEDRALVAKVVFGPRTQGPLGLAHGGSMAAVLDELMAGMLLSSGHIGFAADLHVHYRTTLPIPNRCVADARIDRIEGRKLWTSARLRDLSGDMLYAEADAMFVELVDKRS